MDELRRSIDPHVHNIEVDKGRDVSFVPSPKLQIYANIFYFTIRVDFCFVSVFIPSESERGLVPLVGFTRGSSEPLIFTIVQSHWDPLAKHDGNRLAAFC